MKSGIVSMILAMVAALNPVQNNAGTINIDQSSYVAVESRVSMVSPYDISAITGSSIAATGSSIAATGGSIISQDAGEDDGDNNDETQDIDNDLGNEEQDDKDSQNDGEKERADKDNVQKKDKPSKKKPKAKKKAPKKELHTKYASKGKTLTKSAGVFYGPCGKETYYNMNMDGVVRIMRGCGNKDKYWIRKDGIKMLGDYIMVAASLDKYDRGDIVETSLGKGIVCDTGGFAEKNHNQFDIAVTW